MSARIVTLTLDDSTGEVEMGIRIPEGYDPESKACQMTNMIVNYLDSIADRRDDAVEETVMAADPALVLTV